MESIMSAFYDTWVGSGNYSTQSAVESEKYSRYRMKIEETIEEKVLHDISDDITNIACEAEIAGFENGVRYGIMFMSGMLKGGVSA